MPIAKRLAVLFAMWTVIAILAVINWPGPDPSFRFEIAVTAVAFALTVLFNSLMGGFTPARDTAFEVGRKAAIGLYTFVAALVGGLALSEARGRWLLAAHLVNNLVLLAVWLASRRASQAVTEHERQRRTDRSGINEVRWLVDQLATEVAHLPASVHARCRDSAMRMKDCVRFAGSRTGKDLTAFDADLAAVTQATLSRIRHGSLQSDEWFVQELSACEAFVRAKVAERESALRRV